MATRHQPTGDDDWAVDLLLQAADDSGQKKRLAALDSGQRAAVVEAVRLIATRKAQAYVRAQRGTAADLHGWLAEDPQMAAATALLHGQMISLSAVPIAPGAEEPSERAVLPPAAGPQPNAVPDIEQRDFGF